MQIYSRSTNSVYAFCNGLVIIRKGYKIIIVCCVIKNILRLIITKDEIDV